MSPTAPRRPVSHSGVNSLKTAHSRSSFRRLSPNPRFPIILPAAPPMVLRFPGQPILHGHPALRRLHPQTHSPPDLTTRPASHNGMSFLKATPGLPARYHGGQPIPIELTRKDFPKPADADLLCRFLRSTTSPLPCRRISHSRWNHATRRSAQTLAGSSFRSRYPPPRP